MNDEATSVMGRPSGAVSRISSPGARGIMTAAAILRCRSARLMESALIFALPPAFPPPDEDTARLSWLRYALRRSWGCDRPTQAAWGWARSARWRARRGPTPDRSPDDR